MAGFDDSFFELPKCEFVGPGAGPRPWDPPERTQPLRLDVELVRAPAVDVRLNEFVRGRDGFGFTLRIDWTDPKHEYVRDVFDVSLEADESVPMAPPASMIRFGVAYADGPRARTSTASGTCQCLRSHRCSCRMVGVTSRTRTRRTGSGCGRLLRQGP